MAFLPTLNAILNFISACCLVIGYVFIRRKNVTAHRAAMMTALATSTVFLTSYITYHLHAGVHRYPRQDWTRPVYFTILTTHTILAVVIVPLILRTAYLALRQRFAEHRRWARWTLPLWFYVSVTGVVIYEMLY